MGIADIPSELLDLIILYATKPRSPGYPDRQATHTTLYISWVCSLWRSIALANRTVWARCVSLQRLKGSSTSSRSRENGLRDEFLRRSWPAPLDLYIDSKSKLADPEWLLKFSTSRDVSRIRSLEMFVESVPPSFLANIFNFDSKAEHSLQRLEILLLYGSTYRYPESFVITPRMLSRAPNLKELKCNPKVTVDLPSFLTEDGRRHGHLSRLTSLHLDYVTMRQREDLLQALSIAESLEVLRLAGAHEDAPVASDPRPQHPERLVKINLPRLRSLTTTLRSSAFVILFPALKIQNLTFLALDLTVDYTEDFPIIIESLERLVENSPGKASNALWADNPGIQIHTRGSLTVHSSGPEKNNNVEFAQKHLYLAKGPELHCSIRYDGAEFGDLSVGFRDSKPRMAFIAQALTHDFGQQLLRVLADPFFSTATRCFICKGKEVTFPLRPLSRYSITKLGNDQFGCVSQRAYDLPDALFSETAMKNMQEISIHDDQLPVLSYILKRVKESIEISASPSKSQSQDGQTVGADTDTTSLSNYTYDFLPKLRTLYFSVPSKDKLDRSEMAVYKAMLKAGFLIERVEVPSLKMKATLPGRWDHVHVPVGTGGVPLRKAQASLDELLKCRGPYD